MKRLRIGGWLVAAIIVVGAAVALAMSDFEMTQARQRAAPKPVELVTAPVSAERVITPYRAPLRRAKPVRSALKPVVQATPAGIAMGGRDTPRMGRVDIRTIRETEVGRLVRRCIEREAEELKRLRERSGLDFLEHVDEFAFSDDLVVLTGDFAGIRPNLLPHSGEANVEAYGDARIAQKPEGYGAVFGLHGDDVLVIAPNRENVTEALDKLAGKVAVEPVQFGRSMISGRAPLADLIGPLPVPYETRKSFREALEDTGLDFQYSADVGAGVTGTASVHTVDSTDLQGIGGVLTGALAAGKALVDDEKIATLLKGVNLESGADHVTLHGEFSLEAIQSLLGECAADS